MKVKVVRRILGVFEFGKRTLMAADVEAVFGSKSARRLRKLPLDEAAWVWIEVHVD